MPQEFITENVYCECNTFLRKFFVPVDEVGRGHRNGERPFVRPGFPTIIWNRNHSINFKFGACNCYVSVQNSFAFGQRLPNFDPLVAQQSLKMGQNAGFWPLSEKVFTQSNSNLWCTLERSIWKGQAQEQYQLIKSCSYNHKLIIWNMIVITHYIICGKIHYVQEVCTLCFVVVQYW